MDLEKVYYDMDGNECNILKMVKMYPEWAANRIQAGEGAIDKLAENVETANKKCIIVEKFADNGQHSHWALIDKETGEEIGDVIMDLLE